MEKLRKMGENEYSLLIRVLLGLDSPTVFPLDLKNTEYGHGQIEFIDQTLNESQKDAIRFALSSQEVCLIHGPPGVCYAVPGKTKVFLINSRRAKHIPLSS